MRKFFKDFSFPGGIGSHCTPETPGSIHEGGELGYSVSHAFGAAFDNPDLMVAVVVGDGEVRNRPARDLLALQQIPEPDPRRRGPADPASQRLQDQQSDRARPHLARGTGESVRGLRLDAVLRRRLRSATACTRNGCHPRALRARDSGAFKQEARKSGTATRPRWPMIVLRTPKGWTGPKRSGRPQGRRLLAGAPGAAGRCAGEPGPSEAFWRLAAQLQARRTVRRDRAADPGTQGTGARGHSAHERQSARQRRAATQGAAPARLPRLRDQGGCAGRDSGREHAASGQFLRDIMRDNMRATSASSGRTRTPRTSSTLSTRPARNSGWPIIFPKMPTAANCRPTAASWRCFQRAHARRLARRLSAHRTAWFFSTYEAFVHVIDSMFNQHAKWLEICRTSCPGGRQSPR